MNTKTWNRIVLIGTTLVLLTIALITIIIDPFLNFHPPIKCLEYPLKDERYLNNGISKHFKYDAIITGTSMTQNFKPSEFDELFDCTTIKLSYSGASYKEVNDGLLRAISYNPNIKYILRSLDSNMLNYPADLNTYDGYPEYFYDNNPFNDVNYILNKEVLPKTIAVLNYTRAGNTTPSWDQYGRWHDYKSFGAEHILATLPTLPSFDKNLELTAEDYKTIRDNVQKNVLDIALANPDIEFYVFFPPYSIYYYEALVRTKQWDAQLAAEQFAVEMLLEADNIHIYGFATNTDICSNLNNYTDSLHYGESINTYILDCIYKNQYELTYDNYKTYFNEINHIYKNYDYSTVPGLPK